MGTVGLGKSHPENEAELEDIVEGEPVRSIDSTLNDGEEGVNNPVRQPLCVIGLASGEQCVERVVARDDEAGQVNKEFTGNVEENQEGVNTDQTKDHVDLGDGGLTLKVVEDRVLGKLWDETHKKCFD